MTLQKRKIGKTDLLSYPFILGGNVFGWTVNEKESFDILDRFVDKGFNMIDTANIYSVWVPGNKGGESETIIGKWLSSRKNRNNIVLMTKVGGELDKTHKGLRREEILEAAHDSLTRLQTNYIDLYYTHYDDLSVPIEEVLETYEQLIHMGKVRYIGVSNMSAERVEQSMKSAEKNDLPAYSVIQPEYNLYDRVIYEKEYRPIAEKYGTAVFTYYSLASGFLTGKYQSASELVGRPRLEQLKRYFDERGMRILHSLRSIAHSKGVTPAQLALAWLLHQPTITAPIASVSKVEQLDILKAAEIEITPEELMALDEKSEGRDG